MPLLGAAVGAAAGALGGRMADVGVDDDFIESVKAQVKPGTSALFLLSRDAVVDRVKEAFPSEHTELIHSLLGVLLFDLLPGLLLAVALSLVLFIAAASRRHVAVLGRLPGSGARDGRPGDGRVLLYGDTDMHADAEPVPGVLVVRPDGSLFFGNISRVRLAVRDQVRAAVPPPHTVVLDLGDSYHLGVPVLDTLDELRDELHRHGAALCLAHVRARAATDLARHPLATRLGRHALHPTVDDAVRAATGAPRAGSPPPAATPTRNSDETPPS
ncbi:hypothetical protein GCM10010385_15500 [Streptomyces geysiriensis]|uniref:DUF1269 domain-containing protein n=1 Tax=Streptomyces rochei TaxID=1928 RepID=UPI0017816B02|nr:hypothetical protein GCM10010385_15500 [Streptomyces geysiriensis]